MSFLPFPKEDWFLETLVHWTYQWQWIDLSAYDVLKMPKNLRRNGALSHQRAKGRAGAEDTGANARPTTLAG